MARRTAIFSVSRAEFGWSGKKGGRTVEFEFWDGDDRIGTLQVSEAAVRWRPANAKQWWARVPVHKLGELFEPWT